MYRRLPGRPDAAAADSWRTDAVAATLEDARPRSPMTDIYARASAALDDAGVRWCRLRDRGSSPEDDLLMLPDDLGLARSALAPVGFHERRYPGRGSHRSFLAYDREVGTWVKLDVVTDVAFGRWQEWPTDLAAGWLARRVTADDGPRLAPDDAFWALLLHDVLDRDDGPRRVEELQRRSGDARPDGPGADAAAGPTRDLDPGWILELAALGTPQSTAQLASGVRRAFRRRSPNLTLMRRLRAWIIRAIDRYDPPFARRGITVALLGPDGAGKSSLAAHVAARGPIPVRSVYLGLYGGGRGAAPPRGRRIPGLGTARRLLAMWRGGLVGWFQRSRGRIVIYDRHPLDARLADGARGLGRVRRAVLGHALPMPDVVVVLDAPADVLVARKAEHPVERIEAQRRRYLELARRVRRAHVVDVSRPVDDVASDVAAIIGTALAERGRTR